MKKWFFINYYYFVFEIIENIKFEFLLIKFFDEFVEVFLIGVKIKLVIIGVLIFLKFFKKLNVDMYDKFFWEKLFDVYI